MGTIQGLPDKKGSVEITEYFCSITKGMKLLKEFGVATSAGENGAINIYLDDYGFLRGHRLVYFSTASEIKTKTKKALKEWLKVELPLIN